MSGLKRGSRPIPAPRPWRIFEERVQDEATMATDMPLIYDIDGHLKLLGMRKDSLKATIDYLKKEHPCLQDCQQKDFRFSIKWKGISVILAEDVWKTAVTNGKNLTEIKVYVSESEEPVVGPQQAEEPVVAPQQAGGVPAEMPENSEAARSAANIETVTRATIAAIMRRIQGIENRRALEAETRNAEAGPSTKRSRALAESSEDEIISPRKTRASAASFKRRIISPPTTSSNESSTSLGKRKEKAKPSSAEEKSSRVKKEE